jgi:hypothetical protein
MTTAMTTEPVLESCVPAWHPEGGTMAARAAAVNHAPERLPTHVGMLVATGLLLGGLVVLQLSIDPWLGSGLLSAGMLLLLRELRRVRLEGGVPRVTGA